MKIPKAEGNGRIWVQKDKIFKSIEEGEIQDGWEKLEGKPLPPQGVHVARCYGLYDIGTQHVDYIYDGKHIDKWQRKIYFFWEIPTYRCHMVTKDDQLLDRPLSINKEYTFSTSEKGNLCKDLSSWIGSTKATAEDFEINEMIAKTCMLNIDRKVSAKGRERADVSSIMPLPEEMTAKEAENDPISFFFEEDFDLDAGAIYVPDYLPEWIAKKVMESREVLDRLESGQAQVAGKDDAGIPNTNEEDDNLPF